MDISARRDFVQDDRVVQDDASSAVWTQAAHRRHAPITAKLWTAGFGPRERVQVYLDFVRQQSGVQELRATADRRAGREPYHQLRVETGDGAELVYVGGVGCVDQRGNETAASRTAAIPTDDATYADAWGVVASQQPGRKHSVGALVEEIREGDRMPDYDALGYKTYLQSSLHADTSGVHLTLPKRAARFGGETLPLVRVLEDSEESTRVRVLAVREQQGGGSGSDRRGGVYEYAFDVASEERPGSREVPTIYWQRVALGVTYSGRLPSADSMGRIKNCTPSGGRLALLHFFPPKSISTFRCPDSTAMGRVTGTTRSRDRSGFCTTAGSGL
jgi:hypothetical protein